MAAAAVHQRLPVDARETTMKLYEFGPAASAKRVRVFLSEKGLPRAD